MFLFLALLVTLTVQKSCIDWDSCDVCLTVVGYWDMVIDYFSNKVNLPWAWDKLMSKLDQWTDPTIFEGSTINKKNVWEMMTDSYDFPSFKYSNTKPNSNYKIKNESNGERKIYKENLFTKHFSCSSTGYNSINVPALDMTDIIKTMTCKAWNDDKTCKEWNEYSDEEVDRILNDFVTDTRNKLKLQDILWFMRDHICAAEKDKKSTKWSYYTRWMEQPVIGDKNTDYEFYITPMNGTKARSVSASNYDINKRIGGVYKETSEFYDRNYRWRNSVLSTQMNSENYIIPMQLAANDEFYDRYDPTMDKSSRIPGEKFKSYVQQAPNVIGIKDIMENIVTEYDGDISDTVPPWNHIFSELIKLFKIEKLARKSASLLCIDNGWCSGDLVSVTQRENELDQCRKNGEVPAYSNIINKALKLFKYFGFTTDKSTSEERNYSEGLSNSDRKKYTTMFILFGCSILSLAVLTIIMYAALSSKIMNISKQKNDSISHNSLLITEEN